MRELRRDRTSTADFSALIVLAAVGGLGASLVAAFLVLLLAG
jgi:hypothetical protein